MSTPTRIFLTGASGYLGLHVLQALLAADHEVTALVRDPARLHGLAAHPQVHVITGDLRQDLADAMADHHVCIHLALIWEEEPTEYELLDSVATTKLFLAAGKAGVSRAIYLSSTAVHRPFSGRMTERDPLTPTDIYGATKAAGEMVMWAMCGSHDMTGVVIRSAPIVGPPAVEGAPLRTSGRLTDLVARARSHQPVEVEEGLARQFVGAADVARTVVACLSPHATGTYLCAASEPTAWSSMAKKVMTQAASQSELILTEPTASPHRFDVGRLRTELGLEFHSSPHLDAHVRLLLA